MSNGGDLLSTIDKELAFQDKWRRIMSGSYFTGTALALVAGTAATITSGMGHTVWGSVLAGTATTLIALEKTLLLREKWNYHRTTAAELEALKIAHQFGGLDERETAKQLSQLLKDYALKLPVEGREEGQKGDASQPAPAAAAGADH
jgi:hypothetical protein